MVDTRDGISTGRGNGGPTRIKEIGSESGSRFILVTRGSANSQDFAVRQNYSVHFNSATRHVRSELPGGSGSTQIDDLTRCGRGSTPSHDHYSRIVVVFWSQR